MSILVFEHADSTGIERLGNVLRDHGHRLRIVRPDLGRALPPDLDDVDGIVACGGPQSAYDQGVAWIGQEMDLIRQAHQAELPVVGICLGCQLVAQALGGKVERNPAGIELGWHEVNLTASGRDDPLHAGIGWSTLQFHHHRDHVATLPAGARLIASSAKCKVQTWALGLRTYGFQYHPEVTMQTIERWMREEPEALREAGITADQLHARNRDHFAAFQRVSQRLFEMIALLLMPVDRRQAGLVKDLHY